MERYHTSFHVREDLEPEFVLTDLLEMHFVDMPRFRKLAGKDIFENREHRWLSYLNPATSREDAEELIKMDEGIARAQAIMDQITRDEKLMHAYERYAMSLSDETSRLNSAREEGEALGLVKAAKNLKAMGLSAEQIAAATGLSPGEIARL
ncbi:MAG: Rpn family recombination-promoting nuclease/putative transposase [Spirochaetales bacterium]|nr:Rpn family recombination-promoting nuclease/putative transposase [Spirochaetales bacterium]